MIHLDKTKAKTGACIVANCGAGKITSQAMLFLNPIAIYEISNRQHTTDNGKSHNYQTA
jgi:hypothetical protein